MNGRSLITVPRIALCMLCVVVGLLLDRWILGVPLQSLGRLQGNFNKSESSAGRNVGRNDGSSSSSHDHGDHNHEHSDHDEHDHGPDESDNSIVVSELALKNLGLDSESLKPVELTQYQRSISVPGIIAERPGRTRIPVSAAMTGIVTSVLITPGEAVKPNTPFVKLKLTHEDLVSLQTEYLQTLGKLDVEDKEIARLSSVSESGAVSPKSLLERQYNRDILRSSLNAQRESLRLHGIDREELSYIDRERKLLTELTILTPHTGQKINKNILLSDIAGDNVSRSLDNKTFHFVGQNTVSSRGITAADEEFLILPSLQIQLGQLVNAGDILGVFADYSTLLVEGQAFESDLRSVLTAKHNQWLVQARLTDKFSSAVIGEFPITWIESEIDPNKRTVKFFTEIPNSFSGDLQTSDKPIFVEWQYRPGQRVQMSIPIERWDEQIVLPIDAVTKDGISSYVFVQNGDSFDRVEVHEKYRDTLNVVVENDGAIYPGDVVALKGAHQLQLALKNKAGGGVDPHAGHSH